MPLPDGRGLSKRAVLYIVLLGVHSAITARALMDKSYLELFAFAFQGWPQFQIFSDLTASITLVSSWMIWDARKKGRTVWPYVVATVLTGSFGPLTYLLVGELRGSSVRRTGNGEGL